MATRKKNSTKLVAYIYTEYYHEHCTVDRQTDWKGNIKTKGIVTQTKQLLEYEISKPNEK